MRSLRTLAIAAGLAALATSVMAGVAVSDFHPATPSQKVLCKSVDDALAAIPRGNGDGHVSDSELGPGGWRFNSVGRSFVTFAHSLNSSGDGYNVVGGRSRMNGNSGIINDYPRFLDVRRPSVEGLRIFHDRRGELVLSGDTSSDPPRFALPGKGAGSVRIHLRDANGDGVYEGCAKSPYLKNFGVLVTEGGDFVQHNLFKAYAKVDSDGKVTFFEWTEVASFKNTDSEAK